MSIQICKNYFNNKRKITNKDRKVLKRIRKGGEGNLEANIEESLKNNKMELVDPFDNTMKNSLFFRINISGRIESANVI